MPLTEGVILIGIVVLVVGMTGGSANRVLRVGFGLGLVMLASIELALREHLAGYRSHSSLLAGSVAVALTVPLVLLVPGIAKAVVLVAGAIVFFVVFQVLSGLFRRRSGGLSWRS